MQDVLLLVLVCILDVKHRGRCICKESCEMCKKDGAKVQKLE